MSNKETKYKDMIEYCRCCSVMATSAFGCNKCHQCSQPYLKGTPQDLPLQYTPYDFHEGDYAEDVNGLVGYILYANYEEDKTRVRMEVKITDSKEEHKSSIEYNGSTDYMDLHKFFKRVGKYDFSPTPVTSSVIKEESQPKIENIHTQVYLGSDKKHGYTKGYYRNTNMEDVLAKLNEIIDYINKEKTNE